MPPGVVEPVEDDTDVGLMASVEINVVRITLQNAGQGRSIEWDCEGPCPLTDCDPNLCERHGYRFLYMLYWEAL